ANSANIFIPNANKNNTLTLGKSTINCTKPAIKDKLNNHILIPNHTTRLSLYFVLLEAQRLRWLINPESVAFASVYTMASFDLQNPIFSTYFSATLCRNNSSSPE